MIMMMIEIQTTDDDTPKISQSALEIILYRLWIDYEDIIW